MPKGTTPKKKSSSEEQWEVESIQGKRIRNAKTEYRIKWVGYNKLTWEPEESCNCRYLIKEYEKAEAEKAASNTPTTAPSAQPTSARSRSMKRAIGDAPASDASSAVASPAGAKTATPATGRATRSERSSTGAAVRAASVATRRRSASPDEGPTTSASKARTTRARMSAGGKTPMKGAARRVSGEESGDERRSRKSASPKARRVSRASALKTASSADSGDEKKEEAPASSTATRPKTRMSAGGKAATKETPKRARKYNGLDTSGSESDDGSEYVKKGDEKKQKVSSMLKTSSAMDSGDEKEEEAPTSSRSTRASRRIFGLSSGMPAGGKTALKEKEATKRSARMASLVSDAESEATREFNRSKRRKGMRSAGAGGRRDALDDALIDVIVSQPIVTQARPANRPLANDPSRPVKIIKPSDLPGIIVWDEASYVRGGYTVAAASGVEVFRDREVVGIVAYVEHSTAPYVLVKLSLKNDETNLPMKDAVQAVECNLAARLFPQVFTEYMNRAGPTGSAAGPSGSGLFGTGPSGSGLFGPGPSGSGMSGPGTSGWTPIPPHSRDGSESLFSDVN